MKRLLEEKARWRDMLQQISDTTGPDTDPNPDLEF